MLLYLGVRSIDKPASVFCDWAFTNLRSRMQRNLVMEWAFTRGGCIGYEKR